MGDEPLIVMAEQGRLFLRSRQGDTELLVGRASAQPYGGQSFQDTGDLMRIDRSAFYAIYRGWFFVIAEKLDGADAVPPDFSEEAEGREGGRTVAASPKGMKLVPYCAPAARARRMGA